MTSTERPVLCNRIPVLLVALIATITSSGCASGYRVNPLIKDPTHQGGFLNIKEYVNPVDLAEDKDYAIAKTDGPDAKAARDRLQARLMRFSDVICEQHKGDAFGTESNVSLILTVLTSALSGSAAVVPAILTKSALAAAGAFTNAAGAAFNEKIYQKLFIGTILRAADKSRKEQEANIAAKRLYFVANYNVDDAVRDAQDYHQRCSFYAGLVLLSETIEKGQAPPSEAQVLSRLKTLRDQIDIIDKQIKALPQDRQKPGDPEYSQLLATKFGLQRQVDAELLRLSAASPAPSPAPDSTPKLVVSKLDPATAPVGGAAFTLTVTGTSFIQGATVLWNGAARTTTFVSATELKAAIPATDLATASSVTITVVNPLSGVASTGMTFTVTKP
jgi:hypothetical protein